MKRTGRPRLVLGCSRLGSVAGVYGPAADALLRTSVALGVTAFDTASVYGQGESERTIGRALPTQVNAFVCTKVGQYFPLSARLLLPLKKYARVLSRLSPTASRLVRVARGGELPKRFDMAFLRREVMRSMDRLSPLHASAVLLHSPDPNQIVQPRGGLAALAELQAEGFVGSIGVSIESVGAAVAALNSGIKFSLLQLPYRPGDASYEAVIERAADLGVLLMVREVLGGAVLARLPAAERSEFVTDRLEECLSDTRFSFVVLGTTSSEHIGIAAAIGR